MNNDYSNYLKPKGYEEFEVKEWTERKKLPANGYVMQIRKAKIENSKNNNPMLVLALDIFEGEYKGFFQEEFNNQTGNKKWHCVFYCTLPNPQNYGTESYEKQLQSYKTLITSIEHSNEGFKYNFQEQSLDRKLVGMIFAEEENEYNGKRFMKVIPKFPRSVKSIREGKFKVPQPKYLGKTENVDIISQYVEYSQNKQSEKQAFNQFNDDDLPF